MLRSLSERMNGAAARVFPERRVILRSEDATSYMRLSPLAQAGACALIVGLVGWTGYATLSLGAASLHAASAEDRLTAERAAFQTRIDALTDEAARLTGDLSAAGANADKAVAILSAQHASLSAATIGGREAETALRSSEMRLASLGAEHDDALQVCETAAERVASLRTSLASSEQEKRALSDTLAALTGALGDVAEERNAASETTATLSLKIDELSSELTEGAERRSRLFSRLEDAAEVSLGSLESVFRKTGVKIDPILNEVRKEKGYDGGKGGPFIPADQIETLGGDGEASARLAALMTTLERVNLLRLAAERVPFALPVRGARFTSGFGIRRDPKNRRRARHDGIDLAGSRGMPIRSTAAGRVAFAGRRSGYGNVIEVRHAFGYETVYAHLGRIRVKAGDAVERGDRIGDMGNTGRSTGVHLHYEVRIGGTPVNPSKYIEAARNVL